MMDEKEPLVIRFSSRIPTAYMAPFPPGKADFVGNLSEALSIITKHEDNNRIYLANPPESVLRYLLERVENVENITLFYDLLPKPDNCSLLTSFRIIVPSLAFYYFFRQHGENVKLANLLSSLKIDRSKDKKKAKSNLQSKQKTRLWIDERLVAPHYLTKVAQVICKLLKQQSGLKVIWVSEKRRRFSCAGIRFLKTDEADREKLWQNTDIMLTLGSVYQSFVPLHIQLLSKGIAIITDDRGDHGEWVNHLFTGFVLGRKETCKELGRYLFRLVKNPGLLQQFRGNSHLLVERVLQTGHETATGQFNHSLQK